MQLSTALGGILGASFAICAQSPKGAGKAPWDLCRNRRGGLSFSCVYLLSLLCSFPWLCFSNKKAFSISAGDTVAWILPFTAGGFLYIALVNVVPDLLEEKNPW